MKIFDVDEAARVLTVSPRSLADRRYRERLGLAGRRIGRRLVFAEEDLLKILRDGKERLATRSRGE